MGQEPFLHSNEPFKKLFLLQVAAFAVALIVSIGFYFGLAPFYSNTSSQFLSAFGCFVISAFVISSWFQCRFNQPPHYNPEPIIQFLKELQQTKDFSKRLDLPQNPEPETKAIAHSINLFMEDLAFLESEVQKKIDHMEEKDKHRNDALAKIQSIALENAHSAGMAEVSNGVLHNIGNVTNSINVSVQAIEGQLKDSMTKMLSKLVDHLEQNKENLSEYLTADPKGKSLPGLIAEVTKSLEKENKELLHKVRRARESIDIVLEAIHSQQNYAKGAQLSVELPLPDIIEETLKVCDTAVELKGIQIDVNQGFTGDLKVQKSKIMHILINLIKNAKEAMSETPIDKRAIFIETGFDPEKGVFMEVRDTGQGFNSEEGAQLFSHGFTTKETGHGFGLHHSANAMNEMGGSMSAHSEGPGLGAVFVLWFQYQKEVDDSENDILWFGT